MRIYQIKLLVFAVVVILWGAYTPQPAMAWDSDYRSHTGYGYFGHHRHHHYRHGYGHYGNHLVDQYKKFNHYRIEDEDAYFMLAALYFLLDDRETSRMYVEKVGDGTTSTRNLQRLISNYG